MVYTTQKPHMSIRGTFFTSIFAKETIDFQIKDPKGYIIYTKVDKKEGIFNITTNMPGDYEFVFINKRVFLLTFSFYVF
jgi:p24 family protein beta-1